MSERSNGVAQDAPQPEQMRSSGPADQSDSGTWTAGIDIIRSYPFQDTQWHLHAIEFHHKVRQEAEALRDRWLSAVPEGHGGWQSIDTAPDDGRKIWAFGGRHEKPTIVDADGDWWRFNSKQGLSGIPTHWQPLLMPESPSSHPSTVLP